MAERLAADYAVPHLDLDTFAWGAPGVRRPLEASLSMIQSFLSTHLEWIIEGCYANLLRAVLPAATELRFLNPGVEACVRHCRARPWEPHKYASKEDQDAKLEFLLSWVREYDVRRDEYSLVAHRELFDGFRGAKREYTEAAEL